MNRSLRVVIAALGGEGGGVLADWLCHAGAASGYLSQTTSVPGVAQRTGATIYYLELFPKSELEPHQQPVMSLFPAPGDVDLAICSEIVEAGRMLQRGFITPDRTTVITSTHRTYGISEKAALGDGTIDGEAIVSAVRDSARWFVGFDMQELAREHQGVINSVLLGALCESAALPFDREAYTAAIEHSGIAVRENLACFDAGFAAASAATVADELLDAVTGSPAVDPVGHFDPSGGGNAGVSTREQPREEAGAAAFVLPTQVRSRRLAALVEEIRRFPLAGHEMMYHAVRKLCDYQNDRFARRYLARLRRFRDHTGADGDLLREVARHLGLWMAFEDLPRTAQLKISSERFERFRSEVRAAPDQPIDMVEFLHPRVQEFAGLMPAPLGRFALRNRWARRFLKLFEGPRHVRTNSIPGFLSFFLIASCRHWRRWSLAYQEESEARERWLSAVENLARGDASAALVLARCARLIKGYSNTRERGHWQLSRILDAVARGHRDAQSIEALLDAALSDDEARGFIERYSSLTGESLPTSVFRPAVL